MYTLTNKKSGENIFPRRGVILKFVNLNLYILALCQIELCFNYPIVLAGVIILSLYIYTIPKPVCTVHCRHYPQRYTSMERRDIVMRSILQLQIVLQSRKVTFEGL